jgi:hypothetical protein
MDEIEQMIRNAEEALLGNERLTSDLDDTAANVLLDWGITMVKKAIFETAAQGPPDLMEAVDSRLSGNRKMLQQASQLATSRTAVGLERQLNVYEKLVRYAAAAYGEDIPLPEPDQAQMFLQRSFELPAEDFIVALREFLEKP